MSSDNLIEQAKQRLPLPALMAQCGHGERAKRSALCMFHEDKNPSFSAYQRDDGTWAWKCHGGCGGGDEIDWLAKHRGLSNADACREYIRLAGITPRPAPPSSPKPAPSTQPMFDWLSCIEAFNAEQQVKLASWRGYAPEFVAWLHQKRLIGVFDGERIAFPVHDAQGNVIGCHYRLKEDGTWRYHPTGTRTALFVVGDPETAKTVLAFESQWDLLAALDCLNQHVQPLGDTAFVATRGAGNARLLADRCNPDATVYAFSQNDPAGEKWLAAVAAHCGCRCLQVVTPAPHKDANDWSRAGATRPDFEAAIAAAHPVIISNDPGLHALPENGPNSGIVLPEEDDSDDLEPQPFPIELLPPALAKIVVAVASSERVPFALPAVCALGVTSAAIGAGLEVASAGDRYTRANLFLLADGESGSGKTQVFRRIAEPILEHQRQLHDAYQEKTAHEITSEIGLLTREIKRLESKAAKESTNSEDRERLLGELQFKNARLTELKQLSMSPSVICGDVTSEKLAVLLAANHEAMFSASPEARQILAIVCGRYNSMNGTDEAIYLAAYSGDFLKVDRLGRDSLTLHNPCLAVLWLVQPDAMASLYNIETLSQSGFLPRFLACRTLATPKKIIPGEDVAVSYAVCAQWAGLIAGLLATYHVAEKPFRIEPTPEAKRLLDDFFNEVVDRRLEDLSDVGQFASRYGEQAWRVSVIFHAALYGLDAHNHPLDAETARNAIGVVRWFIKAQLDILTRSRRQTAAKVEEKVLKLLDENRRRQGRDFITAREVHRARIKETADAAKKLLARMEADGLLEGEDIAPAHGGKTTRIYRAIRNPLPE